MDVSSIVLLIILVIASTLSTWYCFMYHGMWHALCSYVASFLAFFFLFPPPKIGLGILEWFVGTIILLILGAGWDWLWCIHLKPILFPKKEVVEEKEQEPEYPDFFTDGSDLH